MSSTIAVLIQVAGLLFIAGGAIHLWFAIRTRTSHPDGRLLRLGLGSCGVAVIIIGVLSIFRQPMPFVWPLAAIVMALQGVAASLWRRLSLVLKLEARGGDSAAQQSW